MTLIKLIFLFCQQAVVSGRAGEKHRLDHREQKGLQSRTLTCLTDRPIDRVERRRKVLLVYIGRRRSVLRQQRSSVASRMKIEKHRLTFSSFARVQSVRARGGEMTSLYLIPIRSSVFRSLTDSIDGVTIDRILSTDDVQRQINVQRFQIGRRLRTGHVQMHFEQRALIGVLSQMILFDFHSSQQTDEPFQRTLFARHPDEIDLNGETEREEPIRTTRRFDTSLFSRRVRCSADCPKCNRNSDICDGDFDSDT